MRLKPFAMWNEPEPWARPAPLPGAVVTERLVVRLVESGDGLALHRAMEIGREGLLPWMAWAAEDNRTREECEATVARFVAEMGRAECASFPMFIVERSSGEVVGGTDVRVIAPGWRTGETGYWIRPDRWRRGYGTEAIGALVSCALLEQSRGGWGLRRMVIDCAAANEGSRRLAERLGFRLESERKRERWLDGLGYHDSLGFAILREEWDFARGCALSVV
ncbi:MAG: GNAT family N-acetyltransferase [Phycisphaerales bacterium]